MTKDEDKQPLLKEIHATTDSLCFIRKESCTEFKERVAVMSLDFYKNYRCRLPKQKENRAKNNSEAHGEMKLDEATADVTEETGEEDGFRTETESEIIDARDAR